MASDFSLFNMVLIWVYWGLLICIPLFVLLWVAQLLVQKRIAEASVLQVGSQVNDLHTKLASLGFPSDRQKVTVLNFFATWCGPCLSELPHLQQVADRFADREDVTFVVVGREESQETLDEFVSKNGYRMPFVADKEGSLYREFAKTIIPRTYIIDSTGTIRFEIIGFDQEKLTELDAKIIELIEE